MTDRLARRWIRSLFLLAAGVGAAVPCAYAQRITAGDGGPDDEFGWSVAVDGDTALVGAAYAAVGDNEDQGAVYVFVRTDGTWNEVQKLLPADAAGNMHFGVSVAIDGDTVIVGADNAIVDGVTHRGAAYVFARSGGVWSETQKLAADGGQQYETFGYVVALEGGTALVGNHGADVGAIHAQGAAHVFTEAGGVWTEAQKLVADDGIDNDRFGYSIALDGNRALVGADNATVDGHPGQGAAYLFESIGGTWQQAARFVADDGAEFDTFGGAVALDDDMALVGARGTGLGDDVFRGAVYAFADTGSAWEQTQKLLAADGAAGAWFGDAVALSGTVALVGAKRAAIGNNDEQGAAYLFDLVDGAWVESSRLVANDGSADDQFGSAVAFVSGTDVLIGARQASIAANSTQGAAWFIDPVEADFVFADGFDPQFR